MRQQLFGHHLDDLLKPTKLLKRAHRGLENTFDAHDGLQSVVVECRHDFKKNTHIPCCDKEPNTVEYADAWITIMAHRSQKDRND
ncbi:heat-shock protein, partial [Lactiplantibacillus plantarum]